VFAQFRLPGFLARYQLGYNFVSTSADYRGKFTTYDPNTFSDTARYRTGNVKTSVAYGITTGTYFPLSRMSSNSSLALDVNYIYNFMLWKGIGDGLYGEAVGWDFSGVTVQMGLPIGLDAKFGADATMNKNQRFCFTFGAGVLPSYSFTSFEDGSGAQFSVSPYAKIETGIFAGICMKARLTYVFSKIPYISKNNGFGGVYDKLLSDFTMTGKSTLMIGFVIMPFSWAWRDNGWWNRSQNSERMYKGWKSRHKNYY